MAAVKFLVGFFCLAFIGGSWGFSSNIIGYGTGYERIIEIARKEIGVRETNCENCGIAVARYLNYVGIKSPAPWCSAWLSWVFGQAGYTQPRTAWSPSLFPVSRLVKEPKPGIVYGLYFPTLKRIAHCGITERVQGDFIVGLEGNTNLAGSRDGDGVWRKIRHRRTIHRYADWL